MDWRSDIRELLANAATRPERRCPYCATCLKIKAQRCPKCGEELSMLFARPPLHEGYYLEALQYYRAGEPARSLESLDLCLRLVPEYAPALRLSAGVSALVGRLDRATSQVARLVARPMVDPVDERLAAAIGVAGKFGQRPQGPALRSLAGRVSLAALVEWVISRTCRRKARWGGPGS